MMADLKIDYISANDLVPYENNSRTHSKEQVEQIKRSMTEFGFTNPILIDEHNGIIAGHGRLQAAQELGIKSVPTILLEGLTEAQRKAYVIADNKLALNAGWDFDALRFELDTLKNEDFDLSLLGFDAKYLDDLLNIGSEMPELRDGDRDPYQQKTFTLHDEQAAIVDDAITLARTNPIADTGLNENSNGNALALICEQWLEALNG
jgi:ParB family transcriptional regulator, chromosome partitioning protein